MSDTSFWDDFFSDFDSDDIMKLVAYYINKSENPDGIRMPTTPQEREVFDRYMGMLDYSPTRHYASDVAHQMIQGISGQTPQMQFQSRYLQGQAPMGGIQMPQIDFSKLPTPWRGAPGAPGTGPGGGNPAGGPTGRGPAGGGSAGARGGFGAGLVGGGAMHRSFMDPGELPGWNGPGGHIWSDGAGRGPGAPRYGEGIGDYLARNPGANPGDYLPNNGQTQGPPPGMTYGDLPNFSNVAGRIADWAESNPGVARAIISGGVGALVSQFPFLAPLGKGAINAIYNWFVGRYGSNEPANPNPGSNGLPPGNGGVQMP